MTDKESRGLDVWIAVNVFGWTDDIKGSGHYYMLDGAKSKTMDYHFWQPTSDRAQAMEVLEKCGDETVPTLAKMSSGKWHIFSKFKKISVTAETLPLAICIFAKKLFSKPQTRK